MFDGQNTTIRCNILAGAGLCLLLLAVLAKIWMMAAAADRPAQPASPPAATVAIKPVPKGPPPDPEPRPIADVLRSGVLIVISKKSQQMYVFKDGALWKSSPVSTGKRGHITPSGVFAILQKRVRHRSNKYSNAPMPFMQRLTWDGIAIHAGRLPGYAASHGCIRLPHGFARELYSKTNSYTTTVVITNEPLKSDAAARTLALNTPMPRPKVPAAQATALAQASTPTAPAQAAIQPPTGLAATPVPIPSVAAAAPVVPAPVFAAAERGRTIQLAAADTAAQAEGEWVRLIASHPELSAFQKRIEPATVNARQVYRLRAIGPNAQAACTAMRAAKAACFSVN